MNSLKLLTALLLVCLIATVAICDVQVIDGARLKEQGQEVKEYLIDPAAEAIKARVQDELNKRPNLNKKLRAAIDQLRGAYNKNAPKAKKILVKKEEQVISSLQQVVNQK